MKTGLDGGCLVGTNTVDFVQLVTLGRSLDDFCSTGQETSWRSGDGRSNISSKNNSNGDV